MIARQIAVVLAVVSLTAGSAARAGELARGDLAIVGTSLEVDRAPVAAATGVPSYLQTIFGGKTNDEAPVVPGLAALGELTGPGIDRPITLTTVPGKKFAIPVLHVKGEYTLQNIRLVGAQGEFLQPAVPTFATINVTDALSTQLRVRQLTAEELRERGIVVDSRNYEYYGRLKRVRNADAGTEYDDYDGLGRPRVTRTVRYMGGAGLDDPPPVSDAHVQRHVWTIHDERSEWTMPITGVEAPGSEVPSSPWLQTIEETLDAGGNLTSQSGLGGKLLAAEARGVRRIESRDRYLTDGRPLTAVYGFADGKPLKEELAIPPSVPFAPATNTGLPAWSEMYVASTRIAGSANQRDDAMRMAASRELGMERFSAWSYDARGRLDQSWLNLRLPLGGAGVDDSHLDADFRQMRTVAPRFSSFERDALEGEAAEIEPLSWTATRRSGDQIGTRTRSIGGQVVSPQLTYTYGGGRREADGVWTYSYDLFGRLKTATRGDRRIEYTWNPDDRLVGRTARRLVAENEWQIENRAEVLASDGLPAGTTFVWDPLVDRLVAIFVEGESTREGHAPQAGLLRQYLHGDQGYDDPTRVLIAAFAGAPPETYFPLIDESGTGSVTAVLDGVGHLVERVLYADPYGDAPRYLHGPVVDRITTDVATNDEGAVADVKVRVHLTERIDPASLPAGVRLATLRSDDTVAAVSAIAPKLEDDFTILWEVPAAQWASLSAASGAVKLEIAVANTLRARAWGNTPPVPMPPWAKKLFSGVDSTAAWPAIVRVPIASMSGGSDAHYVIEDLYVVASAESRAQLLSGFQALPFSEPATGLVYARARWYDPSTGSFLTPDPMGYIDSSNLYAGFGNDPVNNSDPRGAYIESAWDIASLGLGIYQISQWDENTSGWAKALDVGGVVLDTGALVLPFVPGGVGAGLKAYRAADAVHDSYALGRSVDRALDTAQGIDQAFNVGQASINIAEDFGNGTIGWGTGLNALQAGIGYRSLSTRGVGGYRLDFSGGHATASMNGFGGVQSTRTSSDVRFQRWKRGDAIDKPLPDGTAPSWEVVQSRYWKNRYELSTDTGEFSKLNLRRMRRGVAPVDYNWKTGEWESRELHHLIPQRYAGPHSPLNLRELTPDWHAEVDPFRRRRGVRTTRGIQ